MRQVVVHHGSVFLKTIVIPVLRRLLQRDNGSRIIEMILLVIPAAELMEADGVQCGIHSQPQRIEGVVMPVSDALLYFLQPDSLYPAHHSGKIAVDYIFGKSDGLKNLGRLIGLEGGYSHFRGNLHDTIQNCLIVIRNRRVIILIQNPPVNHLRDALVCQIGVDRTRAKAKNRGKLVDVPGLSAFQNQRYLRSLFRAHQMLLHGGDCQQRRNRHMVLIHPAVGKDQDIRPLPVSPVAGKFQLLQCFFQRSIFIIKQ